MKKMLFAAAMALLLPVCTLTAQENAAPKYGTISYAALLPQVPGYAEAQSRLAELRQKYEAEAAYNEMSFSRQFAEFLQGQKDFPQNIMLKRQRDLQEAMEKSLAFRTAADSLLRQAEADMRRPLIELLDQAIARAGESRGYEAVVNLDTKALPYLNPALTEDATPYVLEQLK
ncbi:MAG: OmpH family outer membrane protein [Alloprevotella sp.]